MKNISEIFAAAVKSIIKDAERGTKAQLARDAEISFTQLSDMLTGRRQGSEEQRRAVAKALSWEYEDLLKFGQNILNGKPDLASEFESKEDFFRIPLLVPGAKVDSQNTVVVHGPTIGRKSGHKLIAIHAPDDSMEPLIAKGGLVVVDSSLSDLKALVDNTVYVIEEIESNKTQIRQIEKIRKDLLALKPLNDHYPAAYLNHTGITLIGIVIWLSRQLNK